MKAVDISNFSGVPTIEQAQALRDVARNVIVGCQDPVIAKQQVEVCRGACLGVDLYAQPSLGSNLFDIVGRADKVALDTGLDKKNSRLWLAFDMTPPSDMSPDFFIGWLARFVRLASLLGFNVGIYTSRNKWLDFMGNNSEFYTYPLWYADYDGIDNMVGYVGFGGWFIPTIKQYAKNVQIDGFNVDLNVY